VQVDSTCMYQTPCRKRLRFRRLKLESQKLLSTFAFNFNLRRTPRGGGGGGSGGTAWHSTHCASPLTRVATPGHQSRAASTHDRCVHPST